MKDQTVKTIFFDWDYTLAYTATPQNTMGERVAMMFQIAGLPYTQEQIEKAMQQYGADIAQGKARRINKPQTRRDIAVLYKNLLERLGHQDTSWELMERLYGSYAQLPTFLFEDSRTALIDVQNKGYIIGIISNHSRSARPVMTEMVGDLISAPHIVISEEIGVHKPAKTIFLQAAAQAHTPPANCMLIGDNLEVDAVGAVQSGGFGQGVWLDRKQQNDGSPLPQKISCITSLTQVLDLLEASP